MIKLAEGFEELGVEFPYEEVLKQHDEYTARVAEELNDKDPKFSKRLFLEYWGRYAN